MNKGLVGLILVTLLAGAAGVYQISLNRQRTPDRQQIARLMEYARQGVQRKDAKQAVSIVSKDYKDGIGFTYRMIRLRTFDALNSDIRPEVSFSNPTISVTGDTAAFGATVELYNGKDNSGPMFNQQLLFHFRKENLHKYLIFRTREWRVTAIDGLERVINGM